MKKIEQLILISALLLAIVGIVGYAVYWVLLFRDGHIILGGNLNINASSGIGSFLGGTFGTLFSIVAVLLIYQTYQLQKQELAETRKELKLTRAVADKQYFTNHFFELLKVHRQNVSEIDYARGAFQNRRAISKMVVDIEEIYKLVPQDLNGELIPVMDRLGVAYLIFFYGVEIKKGKRLAKETAKELNPKYDALIDLTHFRIKQFTELSFGGNQYRLAHYYRHLYHTIEFIDNYEFDKATELGDEQIADYKKEVAIILRSQLSDHEIALFITNVLSPLGQKWIKKGYIRKYDLFRNISDSYFADMSVNKTFYQ